MSLCSLRACARALFVSLVLLCATSARADHDSGADLSTPRRAVEAFSSAAKAAQHDHAARVLDLRNVPVSRRATDGPKLARELKIVLDRALWIAPDELSDSESGKPEDGALIEHLGDVHAGVKAVPINLTAVRRPDGTREWLFSAPTVARIPELYAAHANRWLDRLPPPLLDIYVWEVALWQWIGLVAIALLSLAFGTLLSWLVARVALPFTRRTAAAWDGELFTWTGGPLRVLTVLLVFRAAFPVLDLNPPAHSSVNQLLALALVALFGWLLTRVVRFVSIAVEQHAERRAGGQAGDWRLRGLRTQLLVLRRIATILIVALSVALMLMQFEAVRNVGVSMLASAGVAGIVLGLAAQKPITALLAGLQMSITQPIRIGDSVVVQGEFGTIEEIKLSHVVIQLWDERRLIVPTTYFLDNTFQNWTRGSAQLTGSVLLNADFTLPVQAMRSELDRILQDEPLWDGRVKGLVVVDANDVTLQVRALVSASDAGRLFDLRCRVREALLAWLRDDEHGRYLPRRRVDPPAHGERQSSSADLRANAV
ncbi:MAG TPA: mechanosensitive ion channel domain-containing protein [Polyangiaceae bacterium]|nr:mechanosensitive ion channel domain-containing protein [Polyangiaceae bacterium]